MRYAMTGATGFLGSELARQLRQAGHDVVALVRTPAKAGHLTDLGVEIVEGDLDDTAALDRLLAGADGLFHVAGWYKLGHRDPTQGERINVGGTRNALAAAERAGVPRTVYTSTCAINSDTGGEAVDEAYRFSGEHISAYDRTKAQAHEVAKEFAARGLPVVIVQPGAIYGPGDTAQTGDLLARVVRGRRPQVPATGGQLVWAHVADVAHGHLLAMEKGVPGESYMLAGEQATLAGFLQAAARKAGTKGPMLVPDAMIRASARIAGVLGRWLTLPPTYHPETLRAALASYAGRPDKAERELGWVHRSIDDGLTGTIAALRG